MKTPKFASQLISEISIVDQWINDCGLGILYILNGEEKQIGLGQFDSADLLTKYGLIEDNHGMDIKTFNEDGKAVWIRWDDFATSTKLTEEDALKIVAGEEEQIEINEWANEMKSIPDLIKTALA